jgi:hypothetical protein
MRAVNLTFRPATVQRMRSLSFGLLMMAWSVWSSSVSNSKLSVAAVAQEVPSSDC